MHTHNSSVFGARRYICSFKIPLTPGLPKIWLFCHKMVNWDLLNVEHFTKKTIIFKKPKFEISHKMAGSSACACMWLLCMCMWLLCTCMHVAPLHELLCMLVTPLHAHSSWLLCGCYKVCNMLRSIALTMLPPHTTFLQLLQTKGFIILTFSSVATSL